MVFDSESILSFCCERRSQFGDSALGMGWSSEAEESVRHHAMLGLIPDDDLGASLLDFGCGAGRLLQTIIGSRADLKYKGLDISEDAIKMAKERFPGYTFECRDIFASPIHQSVNYDYIIMNGVLTYKGSNTWESMMHYAQELIVALFARARNGIAFNVMSKQVEWERKDLFHLPVDELLEFMTRKISRHIVIRHDYGLYEYTVYAYHDVCKNGLKNSKKIIV